MVDADDAVRSRRAAVVNDRRVTLHPDPAAALRQEPVVLGRRLAFQQYCTTQKITTLHVQPKTQIRRKGKTVIIGFETRLRIIYAESQIPLRSPSGRRHVRSWSQTCSELEFGLSSSSLFCVLYLQRAACSAFETCILNSH